MDTQTWANLIAACNLVIATTAVVCAFAAPRISTKLSAAAELQRTKRQEKLWVFAQLIQNRGSAESIEFVRSLNMIDVIYHDCKEIRRLWREYYAMISNSNFVDNGVGWELTKQKKSELMLAMAKDLKYEVDVLDVDRIYAPRWLVENEEISRVDRQMKLAQARQIEEAAKREAAPKPTASGKKGTHQAAPNPNGSGVAPA